MQTSTVRNMYIVMCNGDLDSASAMDYFYSRGLRTESATMSGAI